MANPIIEQFRQYKIYTDLNERADKVFPTTQIAQNFKDIVDKAYTGEESLDKLVFVVETFEKLQASAYTPLFTSELERLAVDPNFSEFAQISSDIQMPYSTEAAFAAPTAMAKALTEELVATGETTTLVETNANADTEIVDAAKQQLKETDKIVLNINPTTKTAENIEVLYTPDGIADKANITTNIAEAERLAEAEAAIATATDPSLTATNLTAVDDIVSSFNAEGAVSTGASIYTADPVSVNEAAQAPVGEMAAANIEDETQAIIGEAIEMARKSVGAVAMGAAAEGVAPAEAAPEA